MKVKGYYPIANTGKFDKNKNVENIEIKKGRWIRHGISHPLNFKKIDSFEDKYVYFFHMYGSGNTGIHIPLNWIQNQIFNIMQKNHWIQKRENIKYLIVIGTFIIGSIVALKSM
jgi:hypothetical protein